MLVKYLCQVLYIIYLNHVNILVTQLLTGKDKKTMNYNLPRECIRNYFPTRKCFVFPIPTSSANMSRLESIDEKELDQGFRETTDTFCNYVYHMSHVKTVKGGVEVTGRSKSDKLATTTHFMINSY